MNYKGKKPGKGLYLLCAGLGLVLVCTGVLLYPQLSQAAMDLPVQKTYAAAALPGKQEPSRDTRGPAETENMAEPQAPAEEAAPAADAPVMLTSAQQNAAVAQALWEKAQVEKAAADKAAAEKAAAEKAAAEKAAAEKGKLPAGSTTGVKALGVVNGGSASLRQTADQNGKVLATLSSGMVVSVTGVEGQWYAVKRGDSAGYISADMLRLETKLSFKATAKVTADILNIRSAPGSSGSVTGSVKNGEYVDVLGFDSGWYQITAAGGSGYVSGDYLAIGVKRPAQAAPAEDKTEDAVTGTVTEDKPAEDTVTVPASGSGAQVAASAQQYLGCSYSYGGSGPSSFDCSGLTMYVYGLYGVTLPHGATSQYKHGTAVDKSDLQPGDLVFFSGDGHAIGHVGIYVGEGNFVHASTYKVGVITSSLDSGSYPSRYVGARRLV